MNRIFPKTPIAFGSKLTLTKVVRIHYRLHLNSERSIKKILRRGTSGF